MHARMCRMTLSGICYFFFLLQSFDEPLWSVADVINVYIERKGISVFVNVVVKPKNMSMSVQM